MAEENDPLRLSSRLEEQIPLGVDGEKLRQLIARVKEAPIHGLKTAALENTVQQHTNSLSSEEEKEAEAEELCDYAQTFQQNAQPDTSSVSDTQDTPNRPDIPDTPNRPEASNENSQSTYKSAEQSAAVNCKLDIFYPASKDQENPRAYLQNKDIAWLSYAEELLDLAQSESVPLLERLNLLGLLNEKLQVFFEQRVSRLLNLSKQKPLPIDANTHVNIKKLTRQICKQIHELYPIWESSYERTRGLLAQYGVKQFRASDLNPEQLSYIKNLARQNILPFLSPQIVAQSQPFPYLENNKIYISTYLEEKAKNPGLKKDSSLGQHVKAQETESFLAFIALPHQCERIIKLPGKGFSYILLEDLIKILVPEIYSMYQVKQINLLHLTRAGLMGKTEFLQELTSDSKNAAMRAYEQQEDMAAVRLECEKELNPNVLNWLMKKLALKRNQIYQRSIPLDFSYLPKLNKLISPNIYRSLSYANHNPAWPTCFDRSFSIASQLSNREALLFLPYESNKPFIELLKETATDAHVSAIKITLGQLTRRSRIADALVTAKESGIEVSIIFASQNLLSQNDTQDWYTRFKEAGCNICFAPEDYKINARICCITRRQSNGDFEHISHLSTGEYHEQGTDNFTALSYMTSDEAIASDINHYFQHIQSIYASHSAYTNSELPDSHEITDYQVILDTPGQFKSFLLQEIDKQIKQVHKGLETSIFLKTRVLNDKDIILKLVEAAQSGVSVTILVSEECCLTPCSPLTTQRIRVLSLVGRLREASNIYCFGTQERATLYISSAALDTVSLEHNYNIAWPISSAENKKRILTYLSICIHDTAYLRELHADGKYTPIGFFSAVDSYGKVETPYNSQEILIEQAKIAAQKASKLQLKPRNAYTASVLNSQTLSVDNDREYFNIQANESLEEDIHLERSIQNTEKSRSERDFVIPLVPKDKTYPNEFEAKKTYIEANKRISDLRERLNSTANLYEIDNEQFNVSSLSSNTQNGQARKTYDTSTHDKIRSTLNSQIYADNRSSQVNPSAQVIKNAPTTDNVNTYLEPQGRNRAMPQQTQLQPRPIQSASFQMGSKRNKKTTGDTGKVDDFFAQADNQIHMPPNKRLPFFKKSK